VSPAWNLEKKGKGQSVVSPISHVKDTQMKLTGTQPLANVLEHYSLKKSCSAVGQGPEPTGYNQASPTPILLCVGTKIDPT